MMGSAGGVLNVEVVADTEVERSTTKFFSVVAMGVSAAVLRAEERVARGFVVVTGVGGGAVAAGALARRAEADS